MPRTTIAAADAVLTDAAFDAPAPPSGETREPRPAATYWVVPTEADAVALREALGRRLARALGKPWPIEGRNVGGGRHAPAEETRTYWFEDYEVTKAGAAAFPKRAEMDAWRGEQETTDGARPPTRER